MPRQKKDTTKSSLTIAAIAHVLVFLVVFVWAAKTGKLDPVFRAFNIVPLKKPEPPKDKPKPQPDPEPRQMTEPSEAPSEDSASPPVQSFSSSAPNPNAPPSATPGFFTAPARPKDAKATPFNPGPATPGALSKGGKVSKPGSKQFSSGAGNTKSSSVVNLLETRQKAAAMTDSIGSEQISRTGASDAAEVVAKISGASVVDGKFVVVRGLADRYTSTTLNGAEVPSADPYRKAAQLDLFPAQMTDRIVISKTFTPDQPGGFTGGQINIVTKSFPDRFIFSFSAGTSYNTQSSLNEDFLTYGGGKTDWLGIDDGTRAIPDILADENLVLPGPPRNAGRRDTQEDEEARREQADRLALLTKAFGSTEFTGTKTKSPLNQNYALSLGNTVLLFERPLGFFAGMSYKRDFHLSTNTLVQTFVPGLGGELAKQESYLEQKAVEEVAWGTVFNLAYQIHPDHELGYSFLYNQFSEDTARRRLGTDLSTGNVGSISDLNLLAFTERQLHTHQFKGKHEFPGLLGLKNEWLYSVANATQVEPNLRFFNFFRSPDGSGGEVFTVGRAELPVPINPTQYFRNLTEDNQNLKIDNTVPLKLWSGLDGELKLGIYRSTSQRIFKERTFSYRGDFGFTTNGNPNQFLDPRFIDYETVVNPRGQTNYIFGRYITSDIGNSFYNGDQKIEAGYFMLDLPTVERARLIGGLRYETTDLSVESSDPFGNTIGSTTVTYDLLPAAGVIFQLKPNMNLRLHYGETLARPMFREIAPYRAYDMYEDVTVQGNPNLQRTQVKNYDIRWEWFPRPGEVLSVGGFYKDLLNPIERYALDAHGKSATYTNRESATVFGVEFEVRKSLRFVDPLLSDFSVGGNVALIKSEVDLNRDEIFNKQQLDPDFPTTRALYDQSPYIINLDLSYDNNRSGTSASFIYSITGERIVLTNPFAEDIYEQGAPGLDFVLAQRIGQHWKMKFSAKNLLNPAFERTYGANTSTDIARSYTKGRTFGISLSYDY